MQSFPIVRFFDEIRKSLLNILKGILPKILFFMFKCHNETFSKGIAIGIASAKRADSEAMIFQHLNILPRGILNTGGLRSC
jgi:hypothetical protein